MVMHEYIMTKKCEKKERKKVYRMCEREILTTLQMFPLGRLSVLQHPRACRLVAGHHHLVHVPVSVVAVLAGHCGLYEV